MTQIYAAFFSVGAFIFYVIAVSGYSKDYKVLKGCQWFYYHFRVESIDINAKYYFGLKGFYLNTAPELFDGFNRFFDYDSGTNSVVDKCHKTGKSAFALIVVACVLSFITIITNGAGSECCKVKCYSIIHLFCLGNDSCWCFYDNLLQLHLQ